MNNDEVRRLLVEMLHEAAELEHCLLNAYLFSAYSLKSTPEEFAFVDTSKENRRRAIQFERVRSWKQSILAVAREEMLHLHYEQCLLRALGERSHFGLRTRSPDTQNWIIPNWKSQIGTEVNDGKGIKIPLDCLTPRSIARFVLFESTDALKISA